MQAVRFSKIFATSAWLFSLWAALSPEAVAAPSVPRSLSEHSLIYCTNVSGSSFDPQTNDISSNFNIVNEQLYDQLVTFDPITNQFVPSLAESYQLSEDGLTLHFNLRPNVHFHTTKWFSPSRTLTADDVVFSLNKAWGKQTEIVENEEESPLRFSTNPYSYFESLGLKENIQSVKAVSALAVEIQLKQPDPMILNYLASSNSAILSKEYALQLNSDGNLAQLETLPIGTGVYQFKSYIPNEYVRLQANNAYWGKKANIPNMVIDYSTDSTGKMAKYLNKECDIAAFPEPSQVAALRKLTHDGKMISRSGANFAYLAFNMLKPKMQNLAVRSRVANAINRQRIADLLFYQTATVAKNMLPPVLFASPYGSEVQHVSDEFSKKTDETDRLKLWVLDEKRVYNLHPEKMAELIKRDLQSVGLDVQIRKVSRAYLIQQLALGSADYDLILSGWLASDLNVENFLLPLFSCRAQHTVTNLSNWCSHEFDTLLNLAKKEQRVEQKKQLYFYAQQLLQRELPVFPLINADRVLVVNDKVESVDINIFGQVKLSNIKLVSPSGAE